MKKHDGTWVPDNYEKRKIAHQNKMQAMVFKYLVMSALAMVFIVPIILTFAFFYNISCMLVAVMFVFVIVIMMIGLIASGISRVTTIQDIYHKDPAITILKNNVIFNNNRVYMSSVNRVVYDQESSKIQVINHYNREVTIDLLEYPDRENLAQALLNIFHNNGVRIVEPSSSIEARLKKADKLLSSARQEHREQHGTAGKARRITTKDRIEKADDIIDEIIGKKPIHQNEREEKSKQPPVQEVPAEDGESCPECGRRFSDELIECPYCGHAG
jgi:hypothetical protein